MRKKLTYKGKLNILLVTYSFFITMIVLILGFVSIAKVNKPVIGIEGVLISYSSDEIRTGLNYGTVSTRISELPTRAFTTNQMQRDYSENLITSGIVIMLVVFAIVMAISILISKFISRKVIYPIEKIASSLPDIINGNIDEIDENIFEGELSGVGSALAKSSHKIKILLKEANSI
ncbi:MAG: sensor histidine kinase, partial [Clostridium sp.]